MLNKSPELCVSGSAGTGKSWAGCMKLHLDALRTPGLVGLIVRKTHISLTSTTLQTFSKQVAREAIATGLVTWYGGSGNEPAAFQYSNGSRIYVAGADRPERFLSMELDRILVDEAVELDLGTYETLISRLRGRAPTYKQILLLTNPGAPTHWIKTRASEGALHLLYGRFTDNPAYAAEDGTLTPAGVDYSAKLDALTGIRRSRLRDGRWTAAEGVIWGDFDPAVHVVDRFDIPDDWTRYWAVDFGYIHPFVAQWWAVDPDGALYLYRELVHTKRLVEDHAAQMLAQVIVDGRWTEPRPRAILTDHAAEDRATLEKHLGLKTKPAHKTVGDGLQAVASRMKDAGNGRPRLVVLRDSLIEIDEALLADSKPIGLAEEIPGYVWADHKTKEMPVKESDDACDAARYVVAHLDLSNSKARADREWI